MESINVCHTCGACCATFRVSFYWGEADDAPGGWVPSALTQPLTPHLVCMRGTSQAAPRCEQLIGDIPGAICGIYPQRPSPCRELEPYDNDGKVTAQCAKARALHGLPPLPERLPATPVPIVIPQPMLDNLIAQGELPAPDGPAAVIVEPAADGPALSVLPENLEFNQ